MLIPISTIFVSIQVVPSQGYQQNALILMNMGQGLRTKMQVLDFLICYASRSFSASVRLF